MRVLTPEEKEIKREIVKRNLIKKIANLSTDDMIRFTNLMRNDLFMDTEVKK